MSIGQYLLGGVAGLVFGLLVAAGNTLLTRRSLQRAKQSQATVMGTSGLRQVINLAALVLVYLLRKVVPLPLAGTLIGTAVGLSGGSIAGVWILARKWTTPSPPRAWKCRTRRRPSCPKTLHRNARRIPTRRTNGGTTPMGETNVLFSIGPLEVTGAVVTMWVIITVLALLSWLATRRLRDVPGPLQNAAEMAVEKLQGFYGGILGPANARRYFPMMATFFIFIVVSNYIGLLPGAGQVFTVPTATLSVTAGLAIIAFCMTHTVGIQRRGLGGYLKSFIKPFLLMLPLNLIEQIVRPFSLALRLYGNLYGEEMVTHELGNLFPLVLPLLMQVLSLLFCLIQAVVFTMLLSIYIEEAIEE